MIRLLRRLIAVFAFASAVSHAAPMSPDPTGYWYNPLESGWAVTIAQQNDVLFVTLLVYDEQKQPEWFVGSNVRDAGGGEFSGTLYRASAPWFGTTFDPLAVNVRAVGTVSLRYAVNFGGQASLRVTYTVDGVPVTKGVTRLTWDSNATQLPGAYFGGVTFSPAAATQPAGCGAPPDFFPPGSEIRVNMSAPDSIFIIRSEGIDTVSVIGGQYAQSGQFGVITGSMFRGPVVSPFKIADAQVTNLLVSSDGLLGHLRLVAGPCVYEGAIGAIRRAQ